MLSAASRYGRRRIYALKRFLRRITLLTWMIWAALVSDLCAPGYLRFHLGFREVDASDTARVVTTEVTALWKVATHAPDD
ncbi:MAG: hypothetical protein WA885_11385 [Phormidesmis sp.]